MSSNTSGDVLPYIGITKGGKGRKWFKEGYLVMRSQLLHIWRKKYFVVREDKFIYWNKEEDWKKGKKQKGSMALLLATVDEEPDGSIDKRDNVFSVTSYGRTMYVQAESDEERKEWMRVIALVIQQRIA